MPYFNVQNSASDNSFSLRQAEGKVLGRIRPMVKVSTPQPGVRDYRFFADPLSPLPPEFDEETPFGFTGFMSRCGYGYNAFETEDAALAALQKDFGDFFVTFTPALRNNKFYVLDDIKKEGRTFYMDQDEDYIPIPAFGKSGSPAFHGDINKFCRHILTGKPIPGLSKKYWNHTSVPFFVAAATDNYDGKLGDFIIFAPLEADSFGHNVIDAGGAYFHIPDHDRLGYKVISSDNPILEKHILKCRHTPLWFIPAEWLEEFKEDLQPVPEDGNILGAYGIDDEEVIFINAADQDTEAPGFDDGEDSTAETAAEFDGAEDKESLSGETAFLERLSALAEAKGLLYDEKDLVNFHISLKSSRLTILSGLSGTGKSGLVRLYGEALGLPEDRVAIIPVRPSWMDDSDILGYADMKNMIYRPSDTGLTELLLSAEKNQDKMYIVCFDEMNLARAEHYFAQFISVLEKEDRPVIRLYNPSLQNRLYNGDKYPAEITVGKNILFAGTVNVDESTYHFSDKILDRANVLTLCQRKFQEWKKRDGAPYPTVIEIGREEFCGFCGTGGLTDRELALLDDLNEAFRSSGVPCGIGFRVARQMGDYLGNIPGGYDFDREEGLDYQMVQRILTKLRGSARQLESLISLSDKGELGGKLIDILNAYKDLSDFEKAGKVLAAKAQELKLYDYTI